MKNAQFQTSEDFLALLKNMPQPDQKAKSAARARDGVLTKPLGALGRLEEIAIWYAGWRGHAQPRVTSPQVAIFAGNHGVTAQGVSVFPPEVTAQMVANFSAGGAAINQLSDMVGAKLDIIELSLDKPTSDFTVEPAMTTAELFEALQVGWGAVDVNSDLFVAGEMGIGNTTSAAAIATALFPGGAAHWVGPGTGLDAKGVAHKSRIVDAGIELHRSDDPLEILRCLGGREIAAMVGAFASARHKRIPVILDGFIASAAAAVLYKAHQGALDHVIAGHLSEETAHGSLLEALDKKPLLDLGLRLGEGSGAALAISIVKAAMACHSGMATFAEASVSDG